MPAHLVCAHRYPFSVVEFFRRLLIDFVEFLYIVSNGVHPLEPAPPPVQRGGRACCRRGLLWPAVLRHLLSFRWYARTRCGDLGAPLREKEARRWLKGRMIISYEMDFLLANPASTALDLQTIYVFFGVCGFISILAQVTSLRPRIFFGPPAATLFARPGSRARRAASCPPRLCFL